ncbi:SLC13 family permease [Plesiomonas shigelloides]|uniref:SLC13 family permease n=1 Tax=Plesiomonas shigelloides TaxID=703 RepID=UPI00387EE8E6
MDRETYGSWRFWLKILPFLLFILILLAPSDWFMMPGLTTIEQRVIAIFVLAALCWILEPIPIYATSVLIIVLELLLISDKSIWLALPANDELAFGTQLGYQEIMATFASPIIMLFLGGFFLAMAATKYRLDVNLARVLLKPFGRNPRNVMMGLMVVTAVFSMFMSNTATTAMMLSILTPVLAALPAGDRGRVAFALSIPVAANIGGIGTPIGTPPNAVALKYLTGENAISFGEWMMFGVPFVMVMLVISWILLNTFYASEQKEIDVQIRGKFLKTGKAYLVYVTFIATVLLWMFGGAHNMNSYVVALIPVAVFVSSGVITRDDMKKMSWDVLWLVSGGIALGLALEKTGLAARLVHSIPFADYPAVAVLLGAVALTLIMANFMSHTATANLLLPLMAALAGTVSGLNEVTLILAVTFAASLGMALPISTPPNALAHATGMVESSQMAKTGTWLGIIGVVLCLMMLALLGQLGVI